MKNKVARLGGGGEFPYKKDGGAYHQPQKVYGGSFYGTFKSTELKQI